MEAGKEVIKVKLSSIIPNRFQPRLSFNEEELNELANSIKMYGILQPLILRPIGDKYEIIAGERRYKASTIAGLTEVPAILVNLDDQTSAELAIIENIQRKDLTAIEEAKSYKKLLDLGNLTQDQLAAKMGKKQSTIANKLRLLNLVPEAQDALLHNSISERHARSLLQIKDDPAKQREVLNKIIEERLTVKETDDLIKNLMNIGPTNNSNMNIDNNLNSQSSMSTNNIYNSEPSFNSNISESNVFTQPPVQNFGSPVQNNDSLSFVQPNTDVVNITDISNPNMEVSPNPNLNNNITNVQTPIEETVQSALNDLNVVNTNSNVFNEVEPKIEDNINKTQVIDINAIKEAAKNDEFSNQQMQTNQVPNFDSLLKVEEPPKVEEPKEKPLEFPKIGEPISFGNKYFPSLEEESANMSFGTAFNTQPSESIESILGSQPDAIKSTPASISNIYQKPKLTNAINMTRELIANVEKAGNKVEMQELDLADEYQIIIKIKKEPEI